MHAGLRHPPGDRKRAQALTPVASLTREPLGALLQDVAHPVQRFHVVLERGTPEESHLRDVWRTKARHATLAFDRFDHGRLFAADVRSGAAPQMNSRQ